MSRDRDDELARLLEDLGGTLRRLEAEVGADRRRGPFGLPPPPTPREVARFTGEYAIPTAIAILQANVRILELVGALLRAGATADESRESGGEAVEKLRGETVSHLERALAEIQEAIEEGDLPRTPEARDVVAEARRLNADLREYVREAGETVEQERESGRRIERNAERRPDRGTSIPIEGGEEATDEEDGERSPKVDVEEELRSIKEGMGRDAGEEGGNDVEANGTDPDSVGDEGESTDDEGDSAGDEGDSADDDAPSSPADSGK